MSVFFHALICIDIYRSLLPLKTFSAPQPLANIMWHKGVFRGGALKKCELGLVQAKVHFKLKYY